LQTIFSDAEEWLAHLKLAAAALPANVALAARMQIDNVMDDLAKSWPTSEAAVLKEDIVTLLRKQPG
jgi:hypothetical protein